MSCEVICLFGTDTVKRRDSCGRQEALAEFWKDDLVLTSTF